MVRGALTGLKGDIARAFEALQKRWQGYWGAGCPGAPGRMTGKWVRWGGLGMGEQSPRQGLWGPSWKPGDEAAWLSARGWCVVLWLHTRTWHPC